MYTRFFGLNEKPFAITPDPRYLYLSERHAEALAHLLYGITESGGFVQLTGEVGTGKTMLVRSLLQQLPEHAEVALILNPRLSPLEFLQAICEELKVPLPAASSKALVDALNRCLLHAHAGGQRVVLIVDEAQNLSAEVLEQVRLLTNLETAKQKLLQIILIGQPELRSLLEREELRQLAQRITGRYHLEPLSRAETAGYIRHRLQVAGAAGRIFTPRALRECHRLSGGIPRIINVICDRALLGAYTLDQPLVNGGLLRRAASEVFGRRVSPLWLRWATAALALSGLAMLALGLWRFGTSPGRGEPAVASLAAVSEAAGSPAAAPAVVESASASATPVEDYPVTVDALPPAAPPSLALLLQTPAMQTDTDTAFASLFELWGAPYAAERGQPCQQSLESGLHCLFQKGTLAELRVLDHPAILSLRAPDGSEHQVVLAGLSEETAALRFGAESVAVALADLSRYWFGDYLLLWRPPTGSLETVAEGARGPIVAWLRQTLAELDGEPVAAAEAELFDTQLGGRVREFQRRHHLDVDGIVGVQTQIVLAGELQRPGAPTLFGADPQESLR